MESLEFGGSFWELNTADTEEAERNRTSVPELALLPPNPDYSVQISCVCVVCFVCGASTTRAQGHLSIGVYYRNISKRYK